MATVTTRRKKSQAASELIEGETLDTVSDAVEQSAEDDFQPDDIAVMDLLAELGGDGGTVIRIYRQGKGGYRDLTLINEVSVADFAPMLLAHPPYGGGTFRIHARSKGGITMNRELRVEPAPVALQPVQQQSGVTLEQVGQLIAQSMASAIAAMRPAEPANPLATLEGIKAIAEIIKPPVAAAPSGGGFVEQLQTFKMFSDMVRGMTPAAVPVDSDGRTDTTGLIISKGIDMLATAMQARAGQQQHTTQPAPMVQNVEQLPAPVAIVPVPTVTTAPPVEEENDMVSMMKLQLKIANGMALKGADPAEVADSIYDHIPEDLFNTLTQSPDWFAVIVGMSEACAPYQYWYSQVREAVIAIAKESGDLTPEGKLADNAPESAHGRGEPETQANGAAGIVSTGNVAGNT